MASIVFFTFHIKFDKWIIKSNIYSKNKIYLHFDQENIFTKKLLITVLILRCEYNEKLNDFNKYTKWEINAETMAI